MNSSGILNYCTLVSCLQYKGRIGVDPPEQLTPDEPDDVDYLDTWRVSHLLCASLLLGVSTNLH